MSHAIPTSSSKVGNNPRSAFTLLELMLVLAILVAIGAIMTPSLGEIFERQKLKGAANEIRLRFEQARLEAMTTGQTQVFECVLESGSFSVKPLILQSDAVDAGAGATLVSGGNLVETQENGFVTAADATQDALEELENQITFVSCVVATDVRAFSTAQEAQSGAIGLNDLSTMTMSQRILFYPDGSTSSAEVQLKNSRGDIRAVQIRGLTGASQSLAVLDVPSGEVAE
ncbi:MAG: prepilin-type N-terminal cleavage/methylation domain-containing protein [Planctomycetales bacterium]|nr:prepilin-type N-terminal cleavage/methylation domain-containing protein [Planctomycetales bacterium]